MNYYQQKQYIARVDKKGRVLGKIEKWEAHKKGILHKAFTIALNFEDKLLLQHRKHIAFDSFFDVTSSSHQLFIGDNLQTSLDAIYSTLMREWYIKPESLITKPKLEGQVYYKAKDTKSDFIEHELCEMWEVKIKQLPKPNYEYAYGFSLATREEIKNKKSRLYSQLAPWIQKSI